MTKLLTATVAILIAAVIGLGYVAFFYEAHGKAHTQELTENMVHQLMYDHIYELVKESAVTEDSDGDDWAALPGIGCFWQKENSSVYHMNTKVYSPDHELMTWNYVDTRDIWLITSTAHSCKSNHISDMPGYDGPQLATWYIDDNTGEVTYGRPDYDLYESERPIESSGNQPPSSEDICKSAQIQWNQWYQVWEGEITTKVAYEHRLALSKIQAENACFK